LITHRFGIDESLCAYELLESGSEPYLGIVINYPDQASTTPTSRTVELRPIVAGTGRASVGFIGAGNFARSVLIPAFSKLGGVELAAVCTATGSSAMETAKKHSFAYATTDRQKLLSDPGINTIFVTTRHDTHAQFACEALEAGKHVFVEKPLCVKPEQIEQYESATEKSPGKCLMVGFNRRFSPHTVAIREVFASRATPMVITYRVNAGLVPAGSWLNDLTVGGGRIVGEVCHFVDWCEFVTGSRPVSVGAESIATQDARLRSEDSVVATIRYADGSVATIQYVSVGPATLPKERVEVFADGIGAILDDFVSTTFHGIRRPTLKTKQDKGFTGELSAFLQAVKNGGQAPISLVSMVRTTRVTFAILDALRSGMFQPIDS
jgi:polar amino acid transport system substrate-binding protein